MENLLAALIDVTDQPPSPVVDQGSAVAGFVTVLNFVFSLSGFLGTVGILPSSALGVYFLIKNSSEKDLIKKKSLVKKGVICLLLPWVLLIGAFAGYYVDSVILKLAS